MTADESRSRDRLVTAALLIPLCLVLFAPGLRSLPPVDRDEARFAQASRQMWQSNDYVDIRFQDEPRHWKPAGIYWLQSGMLAAAGGPRDGEIWPHRVPSLIGTILAVVLTAWIGTDLFSRRTGRLAAGMLAASFLLNVEARLATTDAALLAAIVAAQGALAQIYLSPERSTGAAWLLWIATGIAILLKGPVVIAVGGGTILFLLLFDRDRSWLKRLRLGLGAILVLAIAGPWLTAIAIETGGGFQRTIVTDWATRLIAAKESHGGPPGYHLVAFFIAFWPFSLLSVLAAKRVWAARTEKPVRFCLAWIVPFWILCELMGTKLPHYVLPAYPAIALLTAHVSVTSARSLVSPSPTRFQSWAIGVWLVLSLILGATLFVLRMLGDGRFDLLALVSALGVFFLCSYAVILLREQSISLASASLAAGALVLFGLGFGTILPRTDSIWLSRNVAESVAGLDDCENHVVASTGFHEPSLVFLLGKATKLLGPEGAAAHLLQNPSCGLALVSSAQEPPFTAALEAAGASAVAIDRFAGINYSKGKRTVLTLYGLESSVSLPNARE